MRKLRSIMHSLVLMTAPDAVTADAITDRLLESRLIACANSFPVMSAFRWKGKIERTEEVFVIFKARAEDFELIQAEIKKRHPYETPCIEMIEVRKGNKACFEWIMESTARRPAGSSRI